MDFDSCFDGYAVYIEPLLEGRGNTASFPPGHQLLDQSTL